MKDQIMDDVGQDEYRPLSAAGLSDIGLIRETNQDRWYINLEQKLFIVSDGMGGRQGGDVASEAVITVLPGLIKQRLKIMTSPSIKALENVLHRSISELSEIIYTESAGHPEVHGMGATVGLLYLIGPIAHAAHMGDSRIYLLRDDVLTRITKDHSVVAMLLEIGEIGLKEVAAHPARGHLSRFVGMAGDLGPDTQSFRIQPGDRFLLCTDGVSGMLPDDRIQTILHQNILPEVACQALVDAANQAGGNDNITAVVVDHERSK